MKTIAIGVGENENIIQACHIFKEKHPKTELKLIYKDEDLVKAVLDDKIDGVVRGSLPASNIMKELKEHYPNLSRATYVNGKDYEFLLSPVGIDEGVSVEDKFEIAMNCCDFLKKLGKTPKIAVLAEGREDDFGRGSEVSNSIKDAKKLTKMIEETSEDVTNYFILIEKAMKDNCNVIIAPNGRVGNIIFRTLILLNSWPSYGAVTFGIDKTYIDTSRDQSIEGYVRSLILVNDLAEHD
ncbi:MULTISPECIES: methanogenesis marker protein Mmp4/MtxX [Methanobrevibacter]|uniref:Phosphate acetyl/butaryl transferase n=1 Tax=Methanobrevibacter thaueri TaxID=190975 RepID=A0A315XNI4_9EURY|nr:MULTISPECIES: methanogenesis marker protein Mmp4/MtxX [Methanobrevibacter]MBR2665251.1 methanogenesis marker protein Mmp4/MtxX [Methanobrevibacter sp.]MBR3198246.1 methanogenesis marker protein Mmp4/MtxX [Methanobrevibacter sp.]MBR7050815.1 methanogenesis marker protein Mmp4/MtxX [Methanobrevibacter sp.]PWB87700.1 phosphate acetyl/butaryl transferase [Methanobrevibacter thaueri]